MDILTLDKQIHFDKSLRTKENYLALFNHFVTGYDGLTLKDKIRIQPKLGFLIYEAYKAGDYTVEDLKNYIALLKKYGLKASQFSQVVARYYAMTGGEPKVIETKVRSVDIESGTIAVSDINYKSVDENYVEHMNQGQIFFCGTGGDGSFGANLRRIDGQEPSATSKELRFIIESSDTGVIACPSGILSVTDLGIDPQTSHLQIKVDPGNYLVRFHLKDIPNKFFGFVIVVCKTDRSALNKFSEIPSLG